ncbi:hypothetical protein EDB87DRAFT_1632786 [Lactarius vividus]|nr:hypothetical protein EDB87DRAFT_1632786 [Lactarius vividus]
MLLYTFQVVMLQSLLLSRRLHTGRVRMALPQMGAHVASTKHPSGLITLQNIFFTRTLTGVTGPNSPLDHESNCLIDSSTGRNTIRLTIH